jgi:hypothetical protein
MTIYVKCTSGSKLEIVSGRQRLQAALQVDGKAAVEDIETGEKLEVHEVGSELLVISGRVAEQVQSIAASAIARAATVQKPSGLMNRLRNRIRLSMWVFFAALFATCVGYAIGLLAETFLGLNGGYLAAVGAGLGLAILFEDEMRKHPWSWTGVAAVCIVAFLAGQWIYLAKVKASTPAEELTKIASEMRSKYSDMAAFEPSRAPQNCVITVVEGDVKVEPTVPGGCDPDGGLARPSMTSEAAKK